MAVGIDSSPEDAVAGDDDDGGDLLQPTNTAIVPNSKHTKSVRKIVFIELWASLIISFPKTQTLQITVFEGWVLSKK
jgi:hypothetical protein